MRSLGVFEIAVPVRERYEVEHPATQYAPAHKSARWRVVGMRTVSVDVRVDALGLAQVLGQTAARNKKLKSTEAGGLVEVVVVKVPSSMVAGR